MDNQRNNTELAGSDAEGCDDTNILLPSPPRRKFLKILVSKGSQPQKSIFLPEMSPASLVVMTRHCSSKRF